MVNMLWAVGGGRWERRQGDASTFGRESGLCLIFWPVAGSYFVEVFKKERGELLSLVIVEGGG